MFVHLTKRTKFLVRVCLFNKRTNTNELPAERFTNCSPNVWFVYSPISWAWSHTDNLGRTQVDSHTRSHTPNSVHRSYTKPLGCTLQGRTLQIFGPVHSNSHILIL
ncbi:hypothetical protein HanIR_Chr15g0775681 [Helianthus annuus]|nr:hypothetical protein HanIR_Chr15g0775681 [Helianthus annuus]